MEIRPYQEKQLEFLTQRDWVRDVVGLESPTGSGKSIVILEYVKHIFETQSNTTVVVTTGSNNLVFEFAEKAKTFGLSPIIYIGMNMLSCIDKTDGLTIFSQNKEDWCSTIKMNRRVPDKKTGNLVLCDECKNCRHKHLRVIKEMLSDGCNKLIITNHQAYLTHVFGEFPVYYPDITIVDEAHLFSTFYSNWKNTEISKQELSSIKSALKGTQQARLLELYLQRKTPLPDTLVRRITNLLKEHYKSNTDMKNYVEMLSQKIYDFSNAYDDSKYYFEIDEEHMKRICFWSHFNVEQNTIKYRLFTATLDRFTRIMFGMNPDSYDNFYVERNFNLFDYSNSDAYIYRVNDFNGVLNDFLRKCEQRDFKSGLILSTTIENVTNLKNLGQIRKYKVYTNINEFKDAEGYKVLVGSRALFQGIDIPEINFVFINKIPFEKYDEEFIGRTEYLKRNADIDPWTDYSIPIVQNTLIQTTGRLWRTPGDFGMVAIDDGRLVGRFNYLMRTIRDVRKGITIHIVGNNPEPENTEGFDAIIKEVK